MRSGSLLGLYCDLVLVDRGPDLECAFIARLFTLLGVDFDVLDAPSVTGVAGLDVAGLDAALIWRAFDF